MTRHIDNNIYIYEYRGVAWSSFPYVWRVIYYPMCVTCHMSDASFYIFGNEKSPTWHVTQINKFCMCYLSPISSCRLKMSKSLKNYTSIQTFLDTSSPRLFRLFCLLHRYSAGVHESCHIYEWVMSHTRHTHTCTHPLRDSSIYSASSIAILLVWMSHVTHTAHTHIHTRTRPLRDFSIYSASSIAILLVLHESCDVTYMNGSCRTHDTHTHTHTHASSPRLFNILCLLHRYSAGVDESCHTHDTRTHTCLHTSPPRLFRLSCLLRRYSAGVDESCSTYVWVISHTRNTHTHIHTYTHFLLSTLPPLLPPPSLFCWYAWVMSHI